MNNSLEAIIALTAMLSFVMILLVSLTLFKEDFGEKEKVFLNKTKSVECATIVDSFFSNNVTKYNNIFECNGEKNFVLFGTNNQKKTFVITTIKKEKSLEVETNDHYI